MQTCSHCRFNVQASDAVTYQHPRIHLGMVTEEQLHEVLLPRCCRQMQRGQMELLKQTVSPDISTGASMMLLVYTSANASNGALAWINFLATAQ